VQNRQHKFFYPDQLENQTIRGKEEQTMPKMAAKIYYLPLPEAKHIVEAPTKKEVPPPDKLSLQEKLMDIIGGFILCLTIGLITSIVFTQIVKRMGWWPM
jgi:hypothetical protein